MDNSQIDAKIAAFRTSSGITERMGSIGFLRRLVAHIVNEIDATNTAMSGYTGGSGGSYTDEQAQDSVAGILVDSSTIDFTYSDVAPSITADVKSGLPATKIADGSVDNTEFQYLNGVTAPIQSQIDGKADISTIYTDEKAQDAVAGMMLDSSEISFTYNDTTPSLSAALKTGSVASAKLDAAVQASLAKANSALQSTDIGTTVQGYNTNLNTIAGLSSATAGMIASDGAGWIKKTYAQVKTALGLTAADVGLQNVTNESKTTMFTAPAFTGAATAASIAATGALTSSGGGVGYATGAGGTVTQATNKSTGVTLHKLCGTITMNAASLAAQATAAFVLTNSNIAAGDLVVVYHTATGTMGAYNIAVVPAAGSCTIHVRNLNTAALAEAIVLRFAVIKAVTS